MTNEESQLQFFETPTEGAIRRPMIPAGRLELRQDHAILLGMVGLIGISIIFACGVERGKQLARTERRLIAPSHLASEESSRSAPSSSALSAAAQAGKSPLVETSTAPGKVEHRNPPAEKPTSAPRAPKRLVSTNGRFAVQVVSYSKSTLAARELQRLQARGESAFLVKKQDKIVLYVGPFDSRQRATDKLAGLKSTYQDCFVRSL